VKSWRNDRTALSLSPRGRVLLAVLPMPVRRAAGVGLLGLTLWLASLLTWFH
jgi:hypothetical protein